MAVVATSAIIIQEAPPAQQPILAPIFLGACWFLALQLAPGVLPPGVALGALARVAVRAVAMLMLTVLVIALTPEDVVPRHLLIGGAALLTLIAIPLEMWRDSRRTPMRVLIIGREGGGAELARCLSVSPNEWSLSGLLNTSRDKRAGATSELGQVIRDERPDLVVLTESPGRDFSLDLLLAIPRPSFRIMSLDHFLEFACGRISIWRVSPLWFMSLLHGYRAPYRRATKRFFDIAISMLVLLFTWPLMLLIALGVRFSTPGPVLYRQVRVGEGATPFEMLKFRTMKTAAEPDGREMWATVDDDRITWIGKYLRRYRLDELPQLFNIIRGDMSFVGPRPERPGLTAGVEEAVPHWSRRLMVRPGVTGWAQVRCGYTDDELGASEKLAYDLYYLKHQTLAFDLAIVLKTFGVVFRASGSR